MRLMSVSGPNGCGKTTLIKALIERTAMSNQRIAIIVNEEGWEIYEPQWCHERLEAIDYIRGGWVGCSLSASLVNRIKGIKRAHHPDWLIIEPSEMVVTKELRDVTAMGLRDAKYDIGPLITLVDGPNFDFLWAERRRLMLGQIDGADLVAVSRVDRIKDKKREAIQQTLELYSTSLYSISSYSDADMRTVWDRVKGFGINGNR